MPSNLVRTVGHEPDPAKRLRKRWGAEMRYTREKLRGWSLDVLAEKMTEAGYRVTPQAISSWERGDTAPRHHNQIGWCRVTDREHRDVFTYTEDAA